MQAMRDIDKKLLHIRGERTEVIDKNTFLFVIKEVFVISNGRTADEKIRTGI